MAKDKEEIKTEEVESKSIENVGVGEEKEIEKLDPKPVEILDFEIVDRQDDQQTVILSCKHPDKEESIKISQAKLKRYDKLKVQGIWVSLDDDKKLAYHSVLANVLRKADAKSLTDLKGKKIDTDIMSINTPILVVKCY